MLIVTEKVKKLHTF